MRWVIVNFTLAIIVPSLSKEFFVNRTREYSEEQLAELADSSVGEVKFANKMLVDRVVNAFYTLALKAPKAFSQQPKVNNGSKSYSNQDVRGGQRKPNRRQDDPFAQQAAEEAETKGNVDDESTGIDFSAYEDIPVEASGSNVPSHITSFAEADLDGKLKQNIERCGFANPSPVQKYCIPTVLARRDLIAVAQTGSGKTAGFMFPIIDAIMKYAASIGHKLPFPVAGRVAYPLAVILAPTRELCLQIFEETRKFTYQTGVVPVVIYGGGDAVEQMREIQRGCDILIATPGRLSDFVDRQRVSLASVQWLALDEADRMLDLSLEPQIRNIVEKQNMQPKGERQTLMFSATFRREIQLLAQDFLDDYVFLTVGRVGSSHQNIHQLVEFVEEGDKRSLLVEILKLEPTLTIVFVHTKRGADELKEFLLDNDFAATVVHGERSQAERENAIYTFKTGKTPIMVATAVAARGLDIPHVGRVINFDLPNEIDEYVHRIGRTGRGGKKGAAISFFTQRDGSLAPDLAVLMEESGQEVPEFLRSYGGRS